MNPDSHRISRLRVDGSETVIGGATPEGSLDGLSAEARFSFPTNITTDARDNLYVADARGTTIRKGVYAGDLPVISAQPQSLGAVAGGNAQFSVIANGTPAPAYQWYLGTVALSGAPGTSLSVSNIRTADAGVYSVVVTNALGSVTSSKATLTVTSNAALPPATAPSSNGSGGGGSTEVWFAALLATFYFLHPKKLN